MLRHAFKAVDPAQVSFEMVKHFLSVFPIKLSFLTAPISLRTYSQGDILRLDGDPDEDWQYGTHVRTGKSVARLHHSPQLGLVPCKLRAPPRFPISDVRF
jgi:hypothetical protein